MKAKILFIILVTAAVTTILVSNTGEMELWLFGTYKFSKLAVMASMLATGFILGLIVGAGSRKQVKPASSLDAEVNIDETGHNGTPYLKKPSSNLSDEDRDYIS